LLCALLCACDDDEADDESADESTDDPLEIEGEWTDDFMGTHSITATSWTQTLGMDTFVYAIADWDNTADTLVAQDEGDDTWSKFQWTEASDGVFYCQTAFGEASREEADAAPAADATDPANGGCSTFPWTLLRAAD
jgi:hypothetical protein